MNPNPVSSFEPHRTEKPLALFKTTVVFVALAFAGIGMAVLAQSSSVAIVRQVLPLVGTALFASGLTFFLLRVSDHRRGR